MATKNALLIGASAGKISSFKKKLVVLFIFGTMLINGFVPSTVEVSKYSIFMMAADLTQNISIEIFGKYSKSVFSITEKVCVQITNFFVPLTAPQTTPAEKSEIPKDENTSDDYALISGFKVSDGRKSFADGNGKVFGFIETAKLFKIYSNYKIPPATAAGIIMVFLVFILAVRKRKEISDAALSFSIRNGKIRVSA